jgi:hypothetical protein
MLFLRASRVLLITLAVCLLVAACSPGATPTPTRRPTRTPASARQPAKVARIAPTETPKPTRTTRPTRTRIPTKEHTPTRVNTPVKRQRTATPEAAAPAGSDNSVPATAEATIELAPPPEPSPTPTNAPEPETTLAVNAPCDVTGGGEFGILGAGGWEGRAPENHPDLNLAVRGYQPVDAFRGLVDYDGETDGNAPQLWGLFADRRTPEIVRTYRVFDWDWGAMAHADLIEDFDVTMAGLRMSEGEAVFTPDFGHEIGEGYVALVLYADAHRVTLKYTGEDNVVDGYTLHLEGLCVYSNLLNLYNERHGGGRGALPALRPGQPIGYMPGNELGVAIRDRGAFLDPRSRKDWWQGR